MHTPLQDAVKLIQDALQSNRTLDDIFPLAEKVCVDLMKDYSSAPYMCPGIIFSYGPVVSECWKYNTCIIVVMAYFIWQRI